MAMEEAKKREKKARKETEETEKVKEKVKARVRKAGLGKDALIRQQNAKSSVQVQHVRHEMTWWSVPPSPLLAMESICQLQCDC